MSETAGRGDTDKVKSDLALFVSDGVSVNYIGINGWTPLHKASFHGKVHIVKWLVLEGKAHVDAKDNSGRTALHWASYQAHLSTVKWLVLEGKAQVDAKEDDDMTPLLLSLNSRREAATAIAKFLLLDAKAHLDAKYKKEWLDSMSSGERTEFNDLEKKKKGVTKLLTAARNGDLAGVKDLVRPNFLHSFFRSAIDVNSKDSKGFSALHYASKEGHSKVVQFLIESKADVMSKNHKGKTALELAKQHGKSDAGAILEKNIPEEKKS
mmetsp:Transcript_23704/g.35564  ORF Transcript_23704/g.35564 Transcript_23704/m.35564 type:complete len:266 (+) Transcript_23704:278-1075(+)